MLIVKSSLKLMHNSINFRNPLGILYFGKRCPIDFFGVVYVEFVFVGVHCIRVSYSLKIRYNNGPHAYFRISCTALGISVIAICETSSMVESVCIALRTIIWLLF